MHTIIIFCLIILATTKITIQGGFAKKHISTLADSLCFNGMIFLFTSLIFMFGLKLSMPTFLFGLTFGFLTVMFQLCYIKAMSMGNVSLTVLIVNLSMVLPIIFSAVFFKEQFTAMRVFGILFAICSFMLNVKNLKNSQIGKSWLLLSLCAFLFNGGLAICQQIFGKTVWHNERASFVAWSYICATAISFVIYILIRRFGNRQTFKFNYYSILSAFGAGAVLGIFQFLNTKAIASIDAGLLFPFYNGGSLIFTTAIGVLLLKDKLKLNQVISILTGIVSIVLINL